MLPSNGIYLPYDYVFEGYYAFLLFGAVFPKSDHPEILVAKYPEEKSQMYRAKIGKLQRRRIFMSDKESLETQLILVV